MCLFPFLSIGTLLCAQTIAWIVPRLSTKLRGWRNSTFKEKFPLRQWDGPYLGGWMILWWLASVECSSVGVATIQRRSYWDMFITCSKSMWGNSPLNSIFNLPSSHIYCKMLCTVIVMIIHAVIWASLPEQCRGCIIYGKFFFNFSSFLFNPIRAKEYPLRWCFRGKDAREGKFWAREASM